MIKELTGSKKRKALFIATCLLALFILYLFSPVLIGRISTHHLRKVFNEQSALLAGPIANLGVTGQPNKHFQCVDESHTHWQTEVICQNFSSYPYSPSPISESARNNYPANAAKLDAILKQNGWTNDRPHDTVATLVASNPYLPQNGGKGGTVPFHKNTGSISCNLQIDFNSLSGVYNPDPGSIGVNEFSCRQNVAFFMPHLTIRQASGP